MKVKAKARLMWKLRTMRRDIKISWSDSWLFNLKASLSSRRGLLGLSIQSFGPIELRESLVSTEWQSWTSIWRAFSLTSIIWKWKKKMISRHVHGLQPCLYQFRPIGATPPLDVLGTAIFVSGLLPLRALSHLCVSLWEGTIKDWDLATLQYLPRLYNFSAVLLVLKVHRRPQQSDRTGLT